MTEKDDSAGISDQLQDTLLDRLQAGVTIADAKGRIVYLNDLAAAHYADRGGRALVGTHLDDCHNAQSQAKIREIYARHRGGDTMPTRYYEEKEDGRAQSIVLIPLVDGGTFVGLAELMWDERADLIFEH